MSASGHILIIDDEASLRQTLARILQRAGFEVTTAINGTEGFSLVSQHLFDMVYLDIRMPDVSGLPLYTNMSVQITSHYQLVSLICWHKTTILVVT